MTDSPGADYADDTDASVTTAAPYDLTGKQGCYVHYDMRLRTETNFDKLRVETSPNGIGLDHPQGVVGGAGRRRASPRTRPTCSPTAASPTCASG